MIDNDYKDVGENNMKGTIRKTGYKTVGGELAKWLKEFRTRWFRKHAPTKRSHRWQFFVALLGALTYLSVIAINLAARLADSMAISFFAKDFTFYLTIGFIGVVAAFFAWMTTWRRHEVDSGPVRVFLAGMAVPAVTFLFIKVGMWTF